MHNIRNILKIIGVKLAGHTMDDQKIQLESLHDYEFVKNNFLAYMKTLKDCSKFSMEELEQVI